MEESINVGKQHLWGSYKGVRFMGTANSGRYLRENNAREKIRISLYLSLLLSSPDIAKTCGWLGLGL